jgi:HSP20 family protein
MLDQDWAQGLNEGQLSIDIYREKDVLVIRALVAGVEPENLDISLNADLLTIRGERCPDKDIPSENWLYQECYWGSFSRSIVLPYHVASDSTDAQIKNGVLEIKIPIRSDGRQVMVKWG